MGIAEALSGLNTEINYGDTFDFKQPTKGHFRCHVTVVRKIRRDLVLRFELDTVRHGKQAKWIQYPTGRVPSRREQRVLRSKQQMWNSERYLDLALDSGGKVYG